MGNEGNGFYIYRSGESKNSNYVPGLFKAKRGGGRGIIKFRQFKKGSNFNKKKH